MLKSIGTIFHINRIFLFLVIFRWTSLIPALLTLNQSGGQLFLSPLAVLIIAIFVNLIISTFNRSLNQLVIDRPYVMIIDLLFSAFILAVSGGLDSPYYLYVLSPLLAGAFFFQARGALLASLIFTPLYFLSNYFYSAQTSDLTILMIQLVGIWLFPILFAYPSTLLKDINGARAELSSARDELAQKHENLEAAHRQLEIIHDLTVLLQAAPDLISVQERVLGVVTTDLGFSKAIVAMVDPAHEEIGGWLVYPPEKSFPKIKPLPLKSENGEIIKALLNRNNINMDTQLLIQDEGLNNWLNQYKWFMVPLYLHAAKPKP